NDASNDAVIAANGRYVVFDSAASDLVANDNNNTVDVFERDLLNQTTALVSVNINGTSADSSSSSAVVSPDGRYISFLSYANDLISGDTTSQPEVFLRDLVNGATTLVSINASGTGSGISTSDPLDGSQFPAISANGRFVSFMSYANDLVQTPTFLSNIYMRDLSSGITALLTPN